MGWRSQTWLSEVDEITAEVLDNTSQLGDLAFES